MKKEFVTLNEGNGGQEMQNLIHSFLKTFYRGCNWDNCDNDSATLPVESGGNLCFTTDSFIVNPIEFPGANIGHLAICGTINDLLVMGATPLGLSLALIIEEGFPKETLERITNAINETAKKFKIPIVTGDTKVMEKGSLDKIIINMSGTGICNKVLDENPKNGDKIIVSGGIGEHGIALLSKRFDFETNILSDSKALVEEINAIKTLIRQAKDPTRGGLSGTINEFAGHNYCEIEIIENQIPIKKEVKTACEMLGLDPLELANEGKLVCIVPSENEKKVLEKLKKFNPLASTIGEVKNANLEKGEGKVILKTEFGSRKIDVPSGKIVPRIC